MFAAVSARRLCGGRNIPAKVDRIVTYVDVIIILALSILVLLADRGTISLSISAQYGLGSVALVMAVGNLIAQIARMSIYCPSSYPSD